LELEIKVDEGPTVKSESEGSEREKREIDPREGGKER
jgi:hypothetical protein